MGTLGTSQAVTQREPTNPGIPSVQIGTSEDISDKGEVHVSWALHRHGPAQEPGNETNTEGAHKSWNTKFLGTLGTSQDIPDEGEAHVDIHRYTYLFVCKFFYINR